LSTKVLLSPLIVICGPTASGKSGLAIALAQQLNAAIISADSRLVYREFNIGTAKPSLAERQQVLHHLIDICEPTETLTLAEYQRQAHLAISSACPVAASRSLEGVQAPAPALLVGGTGLYIRSITKGLKIPQVPPHGELRSQLQSLGQSQCYAFLQQVDAAAALKIHPNDSVRTLRALEVFYVTGQPISQQQGEDPPQCPILQIGLDCFEPGALGQRIARRTNEMVEAGFVDEVEALTQQYGDLPLLKTLGYREMQQYLAGEIDLEAAKALTVLHTRQFAKQQRTWFRKDRAIVWFDADSPDLFAKVWKQVQQFLNS
jgi:tRNA dimethylallyltransferase